MSQIISEESSKKIQILRAAAIVAVVAIHTCAEGPVGVFVRPFLNFAVALFLGLSGFLTAPGIGKEKIFKRLQRVFIPYCIWSVIYTAARGTWSKFIPHFLTGYSCGAFYFIVVYMQLTLLAPLMGKMVRSKLRPIGLLVTPLAIVFEYFLEFQGNEPPKPFNEVFFPVWLTYFYLGMLVRADLEEGNASFLTDPVKKRRFTSFLECALPFSVLIQIAESFGWSFAGYGRMKYTQIKLGSLVTSCLVILLGIRWIMSESRIPFRSRTTRRLTYIGDISFGIYFTHILCMDLLELSDGLEFVIENVFPLSTLLTLVTSISAVTLIRQLFPKKVCRVLGLI